MNPNLLSYQLLSLNMCGYLGEPDSWTAFKLKAAPVLERVPPQAGVLRERLLRCLSQDLAPTAGYLRGISLDMDALRFWLEGWEAARGE